jgi:2-polyprenyl-3-methyl-5-hydroxy-6-metoxy-1,4-benzoquinol methylase
MPYAHRLDRVQHWAKRWMSAVLPYCPMDGRSLDAEYAAGAWDYLRGPTEVARFAVIAGYIQYFKRGARVLELGCGEGLLPERLHAEACSRYLGVDVSVEAITRACRRQGPRVSFVTADADAFVTSEQFDVIVFSECLEYFADPLSTVRRYDSALLPGGLLMISMFAGLDTRRTTKIWKRLKTAYRFKVETDVTDRSGYSWHIAVAEPAAR